MIEFNIERAVLEKLLHNAMAASRLLGHLDDHVGGPAVGPIADRVDEVIHTLSELLGDPKTIVAAVPDACFVFAEGPDDGGEPDAMLRSEFAVAAIGRSVGSTKVLGPIRWRGAQAARVSRGTTLIALVVLAIVATAVIGGAP